MALNSLLNRTIETMRGGVGQATRAGRGVATQGAVIGRRFANRNPDPKSGMSDATLARKVETEMSRSTGAPKAERKGKVNVNAVDGVVWLRGEVKNQAASEALETKVRSIPEVKDVENLLHLPETPAPSRSRGGATKSTPRKPSARRFDRKPAPLGSKDTEAPAKLSASQVTGGTTPTPATGSDGPDSGGS